VARAFDNGRWQRRDVDAPAFGKLGAGPLDHGEVGEYFPMHVDLFAQDSLTLAHAGGGGQAIWKQRPAFLDARRFQIAQCAARSKDAAKVPHLLVKPKGLKLGAGNPTVAYRYRGCEVPTVRWYWAAVGNAGWDIAVAEERMQRKQVTQPAKLGITGSATANCRWA